MNNNHQEKVMLLLKQAGETRRAEEDRDAGWRAMTDGALDERGLAELRAEAEQKGEEHLEELFRPFDDLEQQRMLAAVRAQRSKEKAAQRSWVHRNVTWIGGFAAVAAVGAATLLVRAPVSMAYNQFEIDRPRGPSTNIDMVVRLKELEDELTLRLVRVNTQHSKADPEVRFVCEQGGRRRSCALRTSVLREGDLLISGRRDVMLPGEVEGHWDLSIVVGLPGKGPTPNDLAAKGAGPSGGYHGYQVLRVPLVLERPTPR